MIRRRKDVAWERHLLPEDMDHVRQNIAGDDWYPMGTFERLGNAILAEIAHGDLEGVRLWGRLSAGLLDDIHRDLVAPGDPADTLMRFKVLRSTFFDFEALTIPVLQEDMARVEIRYHMGATAEEAASFQTMGFCEGLLTLADAVAVRASFDQRVWAGDPVTALSLRWRKGP